MMRCACVVRLARGFCIKVWLFTLSAHTRGLIQPQLSVSFSIKYAPHYYPLARSQERRDSRALALSCVCAHARERASAALSRLIFKIHALVRIKSGAWMANKVCMMVMMHTQPANVLKARSIRAPSDARLDAASIPYHPSSSM
jgi:hypothetical protein